MSLTDNRVVNTLKSLADTIKGQNETLQQLELELGNPPVENPAPIPAITEPTPAPEQAATEEVTRLAIMGQGSDSPELHVGRGGNLLVFPLTNPVTASELSAILAKLG